MSPVTTAGRRRDRPPVCIVGAGPAGLSAAVALKRRGISFRILDAGLRPGGIWDMGREDTPMYESAHFISSKTLSGFSDFPMPDAYADYPRHDRIQAYIEAYAEHHDLAAHIEFGATVTRAEPLEGDAWTVTWTRADRGQGHETFSALVVATGVTWHPNVPEIEGAADFQGELRHSKSYRAMDEFRGRRVLIVGAGNSGVDIACDAARTADRALLSLRRGYHFVPKYVFGTPSDVFAHSGPSLPAWIERRVFGFLVNRVLVGDLTRYGLPKPDHPILTSHPIMNTQVLHHLGHGDLTAKPDLERLEGTEAVFTDGSREEVDLVLLATGYRRAFPFLRLDEGGAAENGVDVRPDDLQLMLLHRGVPTLAFMGVFETDGAAYDLFGRQAEVVAGTFEALAEGGARAETLRRHIASDRPDLRGGRRYVDSERHAWYVTNEAYRPALARFSAALV